MPWQRPVAMACGDSISRSARGLLWFLALTTAGCGYTILDQPAKGPVVETQEQLVLPPGHPPIDTAEDWAGRSFLDEYVGQFDPLRFEMVRANTTHITPSQHATYTLRITLGTGAVVDIWQIRVNDFGWLTASYWMQGTSEPDLDELHAQRRAEFRLDRKSEEALRTMLLAMMPISQNRPQRISPSRRQRLPATFWHYDEAGLLELSYRIERMDRLTEEDWPGGMVSAPLDLVQLLIRTWDEPPPPELREYARQMLYEYPMLANIAMLAEGLVLVWEVEGENPDEVDLPLKVGR